MSAPVPPNSPASAESTPPGRGCWKNVFIGCGVVGLVVAAGLLGLVLYLRQRPEAVTDVVMKQIDSHYAAGVPEGEKTELRAAYADFRKALKEHRIPRESLDKMRTTLVGGGAQNEVTREQVRELTALFRQAVGAAAGTSPATPAALSPRPSP